MIQILIDSLIRTSELALLAVGLTMVYDVLRFPSFAHVDFGTVGAFLALAISVSLPLGPAFSIVVGAVFAMVVVGLLGVASDRLVFSRLRTGSPILLMITSFGVGIVLRYTAQAIWGASPHSFPLPLVRPWVIGDGRISPDNAAIIAVAVVAMLALHLMLNRTTLGIAMRATADNPSLSEASGIYTERVIRVVWFIGAALAALGGITLGLATQIQPNMGYEIMLPVFAAAILGGIGNPYGAVLGAAVVGFAENVGLAINWGALFSLFGMVDAEYVFIPVGFKPAIPFTLLIIMLLLRPQGLLGGRRS
ncbi:branched-chain amino acid ABC transporter permease [Arhodomonas sp. SL1]|uniref:branched-chain amino acid ABC transporter permease n=1 Tax=Arhodomonas sp. SL1 TaxID=3425691 RepID=UPI003F8837E9